MTLTIERARQVLDYDAETGKFTRKVATARNVMAGSAAGSKPKVSGYIYASLDRKMYLAHRLAWFIYHGVWPSGQIDHINGDRSDNRLENLRDVTARVNLQNQRKAMITNKSTGMLGSHFHKQSGLYFSTIRVGGVSRSLGYYKSPEEAHAAYINAKRELHEGCTI